MHLCYKVGRTTGCGIFKCKFSRFNSMWLSDCRKHSNLDVLQNTMLYDWWCSRYLQSRTKWFPNLSSCFQNRDPDCRAHEKYRSASALSSHRRMLKNYYISDSVSKIFLPQNKLASEIQILKFCK